MTTDRDCVKCSHSRKKVITVEDLEACVDCFNSDYVRLDVKSRTEEKKDGRKTAGK
jgi:hypothetical protein